MGTCGVSQTAQKPEVSCSPQEPKFHLRVSRLTFSHADRSFCACRSSPVPTEDGNRSARHAQQRPAGGSPSQPESGAARQQPPQFLIIHRKVFKRTGEYVPCGLTPRHSARARCLPQGCPRSQLDPLCQSSLPVGMSLRLPEPCSRPRYLRSASQQSFRSHPVCPRSLSLAPSELPNRSSPGGHPAPGPGLGPGPGPGSASLRFHPRLPSSGGRGEPGCSWATCCRPVSWTGRRSCSRCCWRKGGRETKKKKKKRAGEVRRVQ